MLKKSASVVLGSFEILNGDPAASPLGGAHRLGAPYSSHRAPQRYASGFNSPAALLDSLLSILRDVLLLSQKCLPAALQVGSHADMRTNEITA